MAGAILGQARRQATTSACEKLLDAVLYGGQRTATRVPDSTDSAGLAPNRGAATRAVGLELAAISTYAAFLKNNPTMPCDHRARFLARIARSCEELQKTLA